MDKGFAAVLGNLATGIGLIFAIWSAFEAIKANIESRQANEFSVITSIHERLSTDRSYRMRSYLYNQFTENLVKIVLDVLGEEYVVGKCVDVKKVVSDLKVDANKKNEFNKKLKDIQSDIAGISALEIVEFILLDFDLLAVPFYRGIKSVRDAAEAWKTVLETTAKEILPFIAIQQKLLDDPKYKMHYLHLLRELNVKNADLEKFEHRI